MNLKEREAAIIFLEENSYLEYGNTIKVNIIEKILKIDFEDNINFWGPLMNLKEIIEEEGYLCKINADGSLKIFDIDEMAYRSDKIFKNVVRKMKRLHTSLVNARSQELNNKEFQKHLHAVNKIQFGLKSLTSNLCNL